MEYPSIDRYPLPDDLYMGIGFGFIFGGICGSTHHMIKGLYNSPKGQRLVGAYQAVRLHAPRVTNRFAARLGVVVLFDNMLYYGRNHEKEDPCNTIVAGAATGAFLKLRHGVRPASRAALIGTATLALWEGVNLREKYPKLCT